MTLDKSSFDIDCEKVCKKIDQFIRDIVSAANAKGLVIAISGGIDSAVAAALAVRAVGKDNVIGFILPSPTLDPSFERDALKHAKQLGIKVEKIPLERMLAAFSNSAASEISKNRIAFGNVMARFRMVILYAYANHLNYLVIGTSNKSEIMVGYFTKYGDGGSDLIPCGDLYKSQIRILARYLQVPEEIIEKPPSPGFWKGQTDEGEMGITYEILDLILLGFERELSKEQIVNELKIAPSLVEKVDQMIKKSTHKRAMPPISRLDK